MRSVGAELYRRNIPNWWQARFTDDNIARKKSGRIYLDEISAKHSIPLVNKLVTSILHVTIATRVSVLTIV